MLTPRNYMSFLSNEIAHIQNLCRIAQIAAANEAPMSSSHRLRWHRASARNDDVNDGVDTVMFEVV